MSSFCQIRRRANFSDCHGCGSHADSPVPPIPLHFALRLTLSASVYAVYEQKKWVMYLMLTIWITQLCLMSYTLAHSGRKSIISISCSLLHNILFFSAVVIPPSPISYGCILVADPNMLSIEVI